MSLASPWLHNHPLSIAHPIALSLNRQSVAAKLTMPDSLVVAVKQSFDGHASEHPQSWRLRTLDILQNYASLWLLAIFDDRGWVTK